MPKIEYGKFKYRKACEQQQASFYYFTRLGCVLHVDKVTKHESYVNTGPCCDVMCVVKWDDKYIFSLGLQSREDQNKKSNAREQAWERIELKVKDSNYEDRLLGVASGVPNVEDFQEFLIRAVNGNTTKTMGYDKYKGHSAMDTINKIIEDLPRLKPLTLDSIPA